MADHNYITLTAGEGLRTLAEDILVDGSETGSRNGAVRELTHVGITIQRPWMREILTPGRKASLPAQIAETVWVLAGRNDIGWLSHYLPRAVDFSDDGDTWRAGYGRRIRDWSEDFDQLYYVVELLLRDPTTRQAVIGIWDPDMDTEGGSIKDRACNAMLQFLIRDEQLSLHVFTRSNDLWWGWSGINAFEWSAMQEIVAGMLGVQVGKLHFSITSLHLYEPHWIRAAAMVEKATDDQRKAYADSPRFNPFAVDNVADLDNLLSRWFIIEGIIRNGNPADHLVNNFPEPMLKSWLRVLQYHWSGSMGYLTPLAGTRLHAAALLSPQRAAQSPESAPVGNAFTRYVSELHRAKHAAYGDSWKKRGEVFSILPNIGRKVDRLGVSDDHESSADTAIDLLVYLIKYRWWLSENFDAPIPGDTIEPVAQVEDLLNAVSLRAPMRGETATIEQHLKDDYEELLRHVDGDDDREKIVDHMIEYAYTLAERLWVEDEYRGADAE